MLKMCFEIDVRWPSEAVACVNPLENDGLGGSSCDAYFVSKHFLKRLNQIGYDSRVGIQ